MKLVAQFRSTD